MRKLSLFAALLAGSFLFTGCIWMDFPVPQIAGPSRIGCFDGCGQFDNGHGWNNEVLGTAGPNDYLTPLEEGEYWGAIQALEIPTVAGPSCPWESGGGAAKTRIDTYHNGAGDEASACEPYTYLCGWNGPLTWTYSLCEPQPLTGQDHLCNIGNGQCAPGPFGYTGGTPYLWPPNSVQTELQYICVDNTPGPPAEFDANIRRQPGQFCPDCGSASALQAEPGKTVVCHVPPGNPDNEHTIIVGDAAVPAHLAHGDYLGECGGGGGGGGEGLEVADGNLGPTWALGEAWYADNAAYLLLGQLPFTLDYSSCLRGLCGGTNPAITTLMDTLATLPTDDAGFAVVDVTRLYGTGEPIELSPAFQFKVKLDVVDGKLASSWQVKPSQPAFGPTLRWFLNNTADKGKLDLTGLSLELSNGQMLYGATLQAARPGVAYTVNHERLAQALATHEQKAGQSRDLNPRVAGR